MKIGDKVKTPRFLTVEISTVYDDEKAAYADGYREPTHYDSDASYEILGRSIGINRMIFAAVKRALH